MKAVYQILSDSWRIGWIPLRVSDVVEPQDAGAPCNVEITAEKLTVTVNAPASRQRFGSFDRIEGGGLRLREPFSSYVKTWVAVVDGNKDQLRSLRKLTQRYRVDLVIIVDFIHVCESVWKASLGLHGEDDPAREEWFRERLLRILCGHASDVAAGMRRSATLRGLSSTTREPVDDCANYLLKYSPFLHYDDYLAAGFPIASGVIEGACRHLVKDRMDVTGASLGPKRFYASEPSAVAVTSMSTGGFTSGKSTNETTPVAMPTANPYRPAAAT